MEFDELAKKEIVEKTMKGLEKRGIKTEYVETGKDAFERLKELIPKGAEIMTGGSTTLKEIGFIDILKEKKHPWENWKDKILGEKDPEKQMELRRKSVNSTFFLGSVHAVTEEGTVLVASYSGSQIPSYAYCAENLIWVVGTQKIVPSLNAGFKRLREYCLPLEDKRLKKQGASGSIIGKILVFEKEINPKRNIILIFVNEKLGF